MTKQDPYSVVFDEEIGKWLACVRNEHDGVTDIISEHDTKGAALKAVDWDRKCYLDSVAAEASERSYVRDCERACGIQD
jgi:hypothetical protein